MTGDSNSKYSEYGTSEIANIVDIAESTVRKYCTILEKAGYLFTRNANGYRIFFEKDINTLNEMKNLSSKNIPLERIADMIVLREKTSVSQVSTMKQNIEENQGLQPDMMGENQKQLLELLNTILERQDQQEKFNKELVNRLEQQTNLLKERDEKLTAAIRETLEVKRLLAYTEEKKNKSLFSKWFGRK